MQKLPKQLPFLGEILKDLFKGCIRIEALGFPPAPQWSYQRSTTLPIITSQTRMQSYKNIFSLDLLNERS